jgi:rod shape-determining protein MreD
VSRAFWLVTGTVVIAWVLALLPMPEWIAPFRPEWTLLVLAYWVMALPMRVGIICCWFAGLGLDVLYGSILGQHALALALVGWVVARSHLQVRVYPAWQQALVLLALVIIYEFVLFWTDGIAATTANVRWEPVLTTALLWPWVFFVLRAARRRFKVA